MRGAFLLAVIGLIGAPGAARADDGAVTAQLQQVIDGYVRDRAAIEGLSGAALQVDLGAGRPVISVFAGDDGLSDKKPIGPDTLFQIGSNTKEFTAALILKLEAAGKLRLDDTIGRWLPQYPAWRDVTIRSLLDMTSPIPNYSETVEIGEIQAADIRHAFSDKDLIGFVDPANGHRFPIPSGWFYSNTNYILAGLIIEAASGLDYEKALTTMILEPLGLKDTFYADGPHPGPAALTEPERARVPRALFLLQDCLDYQPEPCSVSTVAPLIGKDMRTQNLSWAGAAGAIVSTPHDLALWIRALFEKRVVPEAQLKEMATLVSQKTGAPLAEATADDPRAFGLALGRLYLKDLGGFWFYEGETMGFRAIFAYWPQYDLLITAAVNSRPPHGEDRLGQALVNGAFAAVSQAHLIDAAGK